MVEFRRTFYSHWGVYIGDGRVIHKSMNERESRWDSFRFLSSFSCCGVILKKTSVHIAPIYRIDRNGSARCNNYLDSTKQPLPTDTIMRNAFSKQNEESYNLFYDNCEHFATWCRYGEALSQQVRDCLVFLVPIVAIILLYTYYVKY
ncbi:phospholipid-metabolizing enzyme A-C1-like [Pomacea canaliculata]|uniref:phospholipid-metabolizing enzyme A-C1-like n=1 Tax=Pomacea canaliculata TaxID=400727 RepID=UPI000D7372D2|nr:phospholipid-metabolizing enzyme A-C1-like [Pomacea canaliculata]